jgi:hypothetical protein
MFYKHAAAFAAFLLVNSVPAFATHEPADKIGVTASVMEEMKTQVGIGGGSSGPIELLRATLRTSGPTDLIIQFTAECALWTNVVVLSGGSSQSIANVNAWIEIDGLPIPVTMDSNGDGNPIDPDDGKVVFCNRDLKLSTSGLLPSALIALYNKTRNANAFNFAALNVGAGVHTILVKAKLDVTVSGTGTAHAAVGKRTLIVEPAKLANDVTI